MDIEGIIVALLIFLTPLLAFGLGYWAGKKSKEYWWE